MRAAVSVFVFLIMHSVQALGVEISFLDNLLC